MRHVELVAFENDSILHQKALLLPIGKVSLRQLGVLVIGILSVFAAYAITDNFWVAAVIFAVFLGIGMPNTKIMTPDQMIKSVILFLIRGTLLSKKPEYLQNTNRNHKKQQTSNSSTQNVETQTNNNIMPKILSQIESLYKEKESKENKTISNENKNYSIKVQMTPENMLNIIPIKTKQQNNNSIDKLLGSLTVSKKNLSDLNNSNNFLQEHVSVLLDDKKLEDDQIISKNSSMMSILLDKSKNYDVEAIVDDNDNSTSIPN
ncbi:MAG: hypothetical protein ACR2LL_08285 [Nitrosopumilus sp.]